MSAKLKVNYVPIDKLKLNPRNPRIAPTSAILTIKKSIEEFGWTNPVLVQKSNNMVIAGHQRIKAAKLAGLSEIPVIFLDLDDTKSLAYNIADNKLAELTEWEPQKLQIILEELQNDIDLTTLGFDQEELEKILTTFQRESQLNEEMIDEDIGQVKCPKCGHKFLPLL